MKGLLGLRGLGRVELEGLIDQADRHRRVLDAGALPEQTLGGVVVANLFFEPSTRTRLSFELASQRLGAQVITHHPETSSALKGESLRDTVLTIAAMGAEVAVVRHSEVGVPRQVADWTGVPVVNAGDGTGEHPTQALADALTLRRHFGDLTGLRVGVVGDVAHSRVAASLAHCLPTLGAEIVLVGPPQWLPSGGDIPVVTDLDTVLAGLDVVYLLRVQTERGGIIDPSYVARFQLGPERAAGLGEDAVVMHPGPMNRGVEITDEVANSARSLVLEQVRNGVPTRMAVLEAVTGR